MYVASPGSQSVHDCFCGFNNQVSRHKTLGHGFTLHAYPHRIWDVEHKRKQKTVIAVKSKDRGARTKVTACGYSGDGTLIGGGLHKPLFL